MLEASWVDVSPEVSTHPASCRLWIVSPGTKPDPRAQFQAVPSEKALLTHFCAAVCRVDPDILVGHGLAADLDLIINRMTVRMNSDIEFRRWVSEGRRSFHGWSDLGIRLKARRPSSTLPDG